MNLPLHFGLLGALEAGAIAFLIGLLVYAVWHWVAARAGIHHAHAIGWSCLMAVAIAGGIDLWNMFYLGMVKLESPVYARIALQKIHDPEGLGARVILEAVGAVVGVILSRLAFSPRSRAEDVA
ncbi:hypothetical protein SAMN05428989_4088 [Pseudoxanthomonas sp. GM95]|uniref:hypothetical protein n=1 Tax=Pseudoxanthomonas sp. GM95 TaxID=1881043 RepID=UPI0008D3B007|nr:hypothetical protein [Pseudoxanthomonas sp. GM95]SEM57388.1 hypothetical protein SAMN05428989_4088 [Pseudoxanthomonas sp. GM95]